jgi:hypothetical protein
MTIKELMARVAGEDLEWVDLNEDMLREMGGEEVMMATLAGFGKDDRPFVFRLPVERLRKKDFTPPTKFEYEA